MDKYICFLAWILTCAFCWNWSQL